MGNTTLGIGSHNTAESHRAIVRKSIHGMAGGLVMLLLRPGRAAKAAFATASFVIAISACSKGDPQSNKPRATAPAPDPQVSADANNLKGDAGEGLKQRLSRQEAAAALFDRAKPEPPPSKKKGPSEPAQAAPPPITVAPVKVPEAPKAPEPVPPVAAAPLKSPPATTSTQTSRPEPTSPSARVISRVDPEFPDEAVRAGIPRTRVKTRVTLDADGNVLRVDLAQGTPRVLDSAVVSALSRWVFEEGPYGRSVEVEVEFKRSNPRPQ